MFLSFIFGMFIGDKDSESRAQRQIEKQSFSDLAMPRRLLSKIKSKIVKSRAQRLFEKQSFSGFGSAEAYPILSKDCESRGSGKQGMQFFIFGSAEDLRSKTTQREKSGAVENKKILFPVIRWLNISADRVKQ
ncbi:MAG: hypothetical protein L6V80_04875 [Bacteroidales bacterium]|nr:MAG: hypothetical protein L6V80_04875 [Bacteroidales bacterium]